MNVYKKALQANIVFASVKGAVSLASLFNLPLVSTGQQKVSLDGLYSDLAAQKAAFNTNSYLGSTENVELVELDLKLAILRDVMDTKLEARKALMARADVNAKRKALVAEQASRVAAAPSKLTDAELEAELAKLDQEIG